MIDVLKKLAELDEGNPQVYKDTPILNNEVNEGASSDDKIVDEEKVDECGMMPMGGIQDHHTPASINITADSGDELSAMLRDIMTLAGRHHGEIGGSDVRIDQPIEVPPPADVDVGGDDTDVMRSMIDKLNPDDEEGDDDTDVKEFDNEPDPETSGYDSMTPTGNDLNSKGDNEADAVNGGGNPYAKTMEQVEQDLFAEYRKFIGE